MEYFEIGNGIVISNIAYATIVYYGVVEIEEVSTSKFVNKELTERQLKQIISLELSEYGVEINVNVGLNFGCNFEEVCKKIQLNVIDIVEQNVGYKPACVNIHVTKVTVC
ncbi:MAG: Asp23/Gls24 family envelope stress response protein [Bacilli bacterium]